MHISPRRISTFFFAFLLILSIPLSSPYHWSGNSLYDLESNTFDSLTAEATDWQLTLYDTPGLKVSYCDGYYILGGYCILGGVGTSGATPYYGQYFYKTYTGLPTHNQVNIKVTVYAVDSWDGTTVDDHFEIGIDSNNIYAYRMNGFDPTWANTNLCGASNYKDFPPFQVYLSYPHTASTLLFKMITCCDEYSCNESLGFRDIEMDFITTPVPYSTICAISPAPLSSKPCPCTNPSTFMYPPNSGICVACYSTCATCDAPDYDDCLSCYDGSYLSGGQCFPCSSNCATCEGSSTICTSCPSGWFMIGTTCYPSCNPPLTTYVSNGVTYCTTPCPGQYVYWDGTCGSTCYYASNAAGSYGVYPSTVNTFLECNYPCSSTSQVLYWNGTCGSSCPSPLSSSVFHSSTFCDYQCGSGQYLYWNGSCLNSCPSPLSGETEGTVLQRKFCWYTCQPNEYLYWNGSCSSTCPSPLSGETEGTYLQRKFCWYTCQPSDYLYWNGSCLSTCPSPLTGETEGTNLPRKFCWYTCQPSEYLYWNGTCSSTCPSPLSGETEGTYLQRKFCWYTCQPSDYLYWNGSCLSTCPSPLTGETQGSYLKRNFCWYTCQPNEYLYWNGSCLSTCPSPLSGETEGSYLQRKFCWYTCQPSEYLYWNGTCSSSCPSPLTGELQGTYLQRKFCWYTCQPNEYLYWNGTCSTTCPSPLSGELQGSYLQRNFCWYICMPWQWLYWDQTCQESCVSPLWPDTQGSYLQRQFCWYPCSSESRFLYWNGTCSSECPEPLSTRYQNGQWFCDYPCGSTQYLYWNGSCLGSCVSPLFGISQGSPLKNFCYYLCQPGEFLYWDGSCQSACDFPLVPNSQGSPVRQFCWYLCSVGNYLYWNGTCSGSCDPPLVQRTTNGRKFCDYPCSDDQYLAWNGSCLGTCPYSLSVRVEGSPIKKNYCDFPCLSTQFLYWNGSCLGSCDSPLSTRIEGSPTQRIFCDYLCVGNQYLYWNGTCNSKCNLPLVVRIDAGNRFCDYLCPAGEIMFWDGTCGTSCSAPLALISQGTPVRQYCQFKCLSTQFLYPNGTCADTCSFPLTSYVQKGRLFCTYPCTNSGEYLYFNGSCLGSCPTPFASRTENLLKYCDYPCVGESFLYWNGSCGSGCKEPLSQRTTDGYLYCDFSCPSSTEFLYWNGTCSSQCPYPLSGVSEGVLIVRKFCRSGCLESQFLYWNQTCSDKCDFPLTKANYGESVVNYCYYPCGTNEYLYWNGSCLSTCSFPLSTRVDTGLNYCDYPCGQSSYLYWNGSCISSCDSPLAKRTESDKNYCDFPCSDSTQYLYYDSRCSSDCTFPLKSYQEGTLVTRNFCSSTCSGSDYIYWNGSCFDSCPSSFTQKTDDFYRYCNPPCPDSIARYYNEELKTCSNICHVPAFIDNDLGYLRCIPIETNEALVASGSLFSMFLYAPLESGTLTIVKLVKIMQYVKYLDINMPPRLQRLGISKGRNVLSFDSGIVMGKNMKKDFFKQPLANVYEKNGLHSSFLVNFWEDFTTIIIAFGLACLFFAGERISVALEWRLAEIVCHSLRVIAKWNAVIMILAINLDDIILYSAVEFKSLNFGSSYSNSNPVSFVMALIFIVAILALSGFIYMMSRKAKKERVDESYQIIFRGFKNNSRWNQLLFLIYMFRIGIPMLVAVCLEVAPLAITILQVLISLGILTFLLKMKPFIKKINQQQIVLFEVIVLIMNFCMFILTILSMVGLHNTKGANVLGDIVIVGNDIINLMCLVFLVIKMYDEIKILRLFIKKNSIKKPEATGLYLQLLFVPLQLGNMGFEEMIAYDIVNVKSVKFRKGLQNKEKSTYEMTDDKANISFEGMDNLRNRTDISTDRHLLFKESMKKKNSSVIFSPEENKGLETFGDQEDLHFERRIINTNETSYDIESPYGNSQLVSLQNIRSSSQNARVFLDVKLAKPHQNTNQLNQDVRSRENFNEFTNSPFEQSLDLSPSTSQEMNTKSSIFNKLRHQGSFTPESHEKPVKSILKNSIIPGSVNPYDFEENLEKIQSASLKGIFKEDFGNSVEKNQKKLTSENVSTKVNSRSPKMRGRIYDYGDGQRHSEKEQSQEDKEGWSKVRKHLNVRDDSKGNKKQETGQVIKETKLNENMALNLWKDGEKHFKPNSKKI